MVFGGLDIGSSGVKCALFNEKGSRIVLARREYDCMAENGHYELDGNLHCGKRQPGQQNP